MELSGGLILKAKRSVGWQVHHFLYPIEACIRTLLVLLIKAYQRVLSPLLRPACRFVPTCSEYMVECLQKRGLLLGLLKGLWRIVRCNPFCSGGYDPVE